MTTTNKYIGRCPVCGGNLLRQPDATFACEACSQRERAQAATIRFLDCTREQTRGKRTLEPAGGWATW